VGVSPWWRSATEIGTCKHIEKVQRKTRSERDLDDQQEALI
jgi:hypothetical protein